MSLTSLLNVLLFKALHYLVSFLLFTIVKVETSCSKLVCFVHCSTLNINFNEMYVCQLCPLNTPLVVKCVSL